ncbi:MAG: ATP synthase F1 subunit gamma [Treponemataceae bacterium]|nr:MAG: ATP synthase F1 subunit gamma [Treponemataceae bacterium]
MSVLQEIKTRIAGVNGTKKITRAMYLISASRSQKAKIQLEHTLPYFNQIRKAMADILATSGSIDTPLMSKKNKDEAEAKKPLYIVLAGDKGMAGGYNHNIINMLKENVDKTKSTLWVAGFLARSLISRAGFAVDLSWRYPVVNPTVYRARDISEAAVKLYLDGTFDRVYLVYTEMTSAINQECKIVQILPLSQHAFKTAGGKDKKENDAEKNDAEKIAQKNVSSASIIYEPNQVDVFNNLVPYYLKGIIYSAFVEAFSSEQNARMVAMDNATKSADETILALSIKYNRARQAAITQEITEIVGGMSALQG